MRGKRVLRKVESISTDTEHVYESDSCIWMVNVSRDRSLSEIQVEFEGHDCEDNSLKKPIGFRTYN